MAVVDRKKISRQIEQKFQLEEETFKRVVKDDPQDRIEIEVGDRKQPDFKPQFKVMRWDNEVNFSMRAQEVEGAVIETEGEVIKYKTPQYEVHQYEKPEAGEDGGFEFEWVLPSKPDTNVLTATLQTKGLDFFYQPALTEKEIAEGAHRPDNVAGSYAAYHKTGRNNRVGGKHYKTGKAFHIYRPEAIDAKGNRAWGELYIDVDTGILNATIPQSFLDTAIYPVVVDPTFGYTTGGGTQISLENTQLLSSFECPEAAIVSKMTVYLEVTGISKNANCAIYEYVSATNASDLVSQTDNVNVPIQAATWTDFPFSSSPSLLSLTYYYLGAWGQSQSGSFFLRYDTVASAGVARSSTGTWPGATWPDPMTGETGQSQRYSIYATYTTIQEETDSRGARLTGNAAAVSNRSARLTGFLSVGSGRGARLTGTATTNSMRSAKVAGDAIATSTRVAKLTGSNQATSNRGANLTGTDTANSNRSTKITGHATASSPRGAKLTGVFAGTSSRGATMISTATQSSSRNAKLSGEAYYPNMIHSPMKTVLTTKQRKTFLQ